jgi:hypothetical protein
LLPSNIHTGLYTYIDSIHTDLYNVN